MYAKISSANQQNTWDQQVACTKIVGVTTTVTSKLIRRMEQNFQNKSRSLKKQYQL